MISLLVQSIADTHGVAAAIAQLSRTSDIIVLAGEMGAGKTAFAQGFGATLGVDEPITSPTFTLVHTYDTGRVTLHHADLYRLDKLSEVSDLALHEMVDGDGVMLVEWGDVASELLGDHLEVFLRHNTDHADDERSIVIHSVGTQWASRLERLKTSLTLWLED
ncbi:MAG: tRNA (adenosine(37)-N6)-threonylcarbamoyltransferase complex ATPase subunit type 1 TsaE [Actinomycetota bacterium]|nr:tRNA (adenosine(37)-N6)-threonylcarbamoyltransferase complex ATPase subunit type 1 TsaE [Actinomycetota bacterium]MDA3019620.1 tRNA (adenosine(37)-N6)-threonylcarbamoyltransferase complex ATPase subunit type 1 TsaE [Actinomycetota bacterium]